MAIAIHAQTAKPAVLNAARRLETQLNALSDDEIAAVIEAAARALQEADAAPSPVVSMLTGGRVATPEQRVALEIDALRRSFASRRELLEGALTASQVAELLHTSRQTPHDRVAAGTLLAVMDRGALRFPSWQFDPEGPDGI